MTRRLLAVAVSLACSGFVVTTDTAQAAGAAPVDPNTACATKFSATRVPGDPNAVVLRVLDPVRPLSGIVTAFGADRTWSGTIGRSVAAVKYGVEEHSLVVRADAPIEGLTYAPAFATCTFYAGTRPRDGYDADDLERPVLTLANPQPIEPVNCSRPYAAVTVKHALEPQLQFDFAPVKGIVSVGVALDAQGVAQFVRLIASSSPDLISSALYAAKHSEYTGAVFRCKPVPSGYEFNVSYG